MADEAFAVLHVLCSFTGREIDPVDVHSVGMPGWSSGPGWLGWQDGAVSPTPEFPELYHISVELSCLIEPLFPFPAHLLLSFWESSGSHHDGKLVGYPSLEGIHQDAIKVNSAVGLG